MIAGKRLDSWTAFFLATTIATSVTGFGFPISGVTPGIVIGVISLLVLAVAVYSRYGGHLAGAWRLAYVITAVIALYLNFLVLIVQSFRKVPAPERGWLPKDRNRRLLSRRLLRCWHLSSLVSLPR